MLHAVRLPGHDVGREGREQVAELLILAPRLMWMGIEGRHGRRRGGERVVAEGHTRRSRHAEAAAVMVVGGWVVVVVVVVMVVAAVVVVVVGGDLLFVLLLSLNHAVIRRDDHVEDRLSKRSGVSMA